MDRIKIKEAIIVEGRDDCDAVGKAFDTLIIPTHGFGITEETWELIEKAYDEIGIIVLTDPDYSGERIRERILERFPEAGQAYVPRELALRGDDVGVENATPEVIAEAVGKAHKSTGMKRGNINIGLMAELGLAGSEGAAERRAHAAKKLGIGYSNVKTFIKKVNAFGITENELREACEYEE